MKTKTYPDYVKTYATKGHVIHLVGDKYYLYKRTSVRIPGKKYPQPREKYLGRITEDGLVVTEVVKVSLKDIRVFEYGYSYLVQKLCPQEWKELLGNQWKDVLYTIILKDSTNSYLKKTTQIPDMSKIRAQIASQSSRLFQRIYSKYGVTHAELLSLKTIYLLEIDSHKVLSEIDENQQGILTKLHMILEVG